MHGLQVALANTAIAGLDRLPASGGNPSGRRWSTPNASVCRSGCSSRRPAPAARRAAGWPRGWRGIALIASACTLGYAIGTPIADAIFGNSSWGDYLRSRPPAARLRPDRGVLRDRLGWFYMRAARRARSARRSPPPRTRPRSRG
jgi:hypothetical protein